MSQIAFQGNASGTGTFTIAAPNSNTNRTLNIPDASGTLLIDGNNNNINASSVNSGQLAGMRNKIINGAFDIWQRGVSSNIAGGTFTADRWRQGGSTSGTFVVERTQTTANLTSFGFISKAYCLRWNQSVAASTQMTLDQRIEDSRTLAGQTVTLSFIARLNSGSFSGATVQLGQSFGTGGSTSVLQTAQSISGLTTSFQKFSFQFTLPDVGSKTIGAGDYLYVAINMPTTGTWDFEITGVQLEVGAVATPFEQRPIGTELALCQRYYAKLSPRYMAAQYLITDEVAAQHVPWPVEMRTAPTVTQNGLSVRTDAGSFVSTSLGANSAINTYGINYTVNRTGAVTTSSYVVYADGLTASAEL